VAEHAGQRTAAGLRGSGAAAVSDGGDELVEARNGGFAEAERADAGKDVSVEVVAVEPGCVGGLGAVGNVLADVGVPALGDVTDAGGGAERIASRWGALGQGGLEGSIWSVPDFIDTD
jgi:hypothetical protein